MSVLGAPSLLFFVVVFVKEGKNFLALLFFLFVIPFLF